MDKIFTIIVVGPTASGKTSLGVEIAKYYGGEVVSSDSMQIYKNMQIATAAPNETEMKGIPHHLIGFLEPDENYSVARYKQDAFRIICDIDFRGKIPVIVGGTGLYVDTLINNISFFETDSSSTVRSELLKRAETEGTQKLYEELFSIDRESAEKIHFNNTKKIIRALEVYYQTGRTISEQVRESRNEESIIKPVIIGLNASDRQFLYDRINRRVDIMLENGLVDEAKAFYAKYGKGTANQAIGYKELLPYFSGESDLQSAAKNLKMQTRRYAKRQLTWFRRNKDINWINIDENSEDELLKKAIEIIDTWRDL